jgi:hypothetical protein
MKAQTDLEEKNQDGLQMSWSWGNEKKTERIIVVDEEAGQMTKRCNFLELNLKKEKI